MTRSKQRRDTHGRRKAGVAKREAAKRKDGRGKKRAKIAKMKSGIKALIWQRKGFISAEAYEEYKRGDVL
jgi:hypothetical protein